MKSSQASGSARDLRARAGEPGAQLLIADLHRQQRVLQLGQCVIGGLDRVGGVLERGARILGRGRRRHGKVTARKSGALGEVGVRALQLPVGALQRAEESRLHAIAGLLVEVLVGLAEGGHRDAQLPRPRQPRRPGSASGPPRWCTPWPEV